MEILQIEMKGRLNNFSYIIFDSLSGEAAVVDPGCVCLIKRFKMNSILQLLKMRNLTLKYIINTHGHFDHVNGNRFLQRVTDTKILSYATGLRDGDSIYLGKSELQVIETPGHCSDAICLYSGKNLFTGDTLFVGDSGATVSADSNRDDLGRSIRKLIQNCPPDTVIWPGHDLGQSQTSTLAGEQINNVNSEEYKMKSVVFSPESES